MIINKGVMSLSATYIPISRIHIVDLIEYFNNKLTKVNRNATKTEIASAVLVTSFDFAKAIPNQIRIGKNVKIHDNIWKK
jgi:hypothetical protein